MICKCTFYATRFQSLFIACFVIAVTKLADSTATSCNNTQTNVDLLSCMTPSGISTFRDFQYICSFICMMTVLFELQPLTGRHMVLAKGCSTRYVQVASNINIQEFYNFMAT